MNIRERLPFELMAIDPSLRVFLRVASLIPTIEDNECAHLAYVRVLDRGKIVMAFNWKRMSLLTPSQQMFVIAHEAAHLLLMHFRRGERRQNKKLWNLATDAKINDLLMHEYSGSIEPVRIDGELYGIYLDDLIKNKLLKLKEFESKNMLSAEEIYNRMLSNMEDEDDDMVGELIDSMDADRIDEHCASIDDGDLLGEELTTRIKEIINDEKDVHGSEHGNFFKALGLDLAPDFPFEQVLNRILYDDKIDYGRQHRRVHVPDLYIPRYRNERFKIYVGVDISQSCEGNAEHFLNYVTGLPEFVEVVFIDTQIRHIWSSMEPMPPGLFGFGGTDLNPLFERWAEIEATIKEPVDFILLTDGEIPPLKVGPMASNVVVLTTNAPVYYPASVIPYKQIHIQGESK